MGDPAPSLRPIPEIDLLSISVFHWSHPMIPITRSLPLAVVTWHQP
jgi:hypothetical protein